MKAWRVVFTFIDIDHEETTSTILFTDAYNVFDPSNTEHLNILTEKLRQQCQAFEATLEIIELQGTYIYDGNVAFMPATPPGV